MAFFDARGNYCSIKSESPLGVGGENKLWTLTQELTVCLSNGYIQCTSICDILRQ